MGDLINLVYAILVVVAFYGIAWVARDQYKLRRERIIKAWETRDTTKATLLASEPGLDVTGELTTNAKYAI